MIEELRRKLEDASFRRGVYAKSNNYGVAKSVFRETIGHARYNPETWNADSPSLNLTKDNQSKSTLFPITVFGERLRKRIVDEQKLEKKDRQPSNLNTDGSTDVCAERYIVESDKENGSLCDINSCDIPEMQTSIVVEYSESERTKDPTVTSRIKTKDFLQNSRTEVEMRVERKSTSVVKSTGKRANDETDGPISVKRILSTEGNEYDTTESNRERDFIKHNKSNSSKHFSEKQRDAFKGSHVERARDSSIEGKTRGDLVSDGIKKPNYRRQGKKNESDLSCEKIDFLNDHLSKRCTRKQTVQNTIHRGTEIFDKRKNHGITTDERRRAKQREGRRMTITEEDCRSRGRLTSSYGKFREERYDRTKHNNNRRDTCEDRCEPCYDFRSSSANKVKTSNLVDKELCCNPRVMIERTKRSSMDRGGKRACSVQSSGRHDGYESRKLKTGVEATKRERKQEECNDEYSRKKCVKREKSIGKSDCLFDRFSRSEQAETDCAAARLHGGESRECVGKAEELELEDGERLASPVNSPINNNSRRERSTDDRRDAINAQKLSSLVDEVEKNIEPDEKVKGAISAEESETLPDHVSRCFPTITNTNAASSDETRVGNTESIENVENVENIEKFIRDYLSNGESVTEVPADSNKQTVTVTVANVSTDSGVVNDDDSQKRSNESQLPDTKVDEQFSLNGKEAINPKNETVVAGNASLCVSKCSVENSQVEPQPTMVTFVENVDHVPENERAQIDSVVELSEKNCTLDEETAKNMSILFQIEPPLESNTVKQSCRTVLESYREGECDGNVDNNYRDRCNDLDVKTPKVGDNHDDHNKIDADNSCKKNTDTKEGMVNASVARTTLENETVSKVGGEDGVRLGKPLTNVQGKIVIFARRKKPICLANNNANMTVLIRNNHEANISLHGTKNATVCDSLPKLRICRRPRREENKSVGS
ncbi:FLICE-associated huge protein [Andrena cerasifolii]|uniref:FLICE-associated huge protein n=1 Tax=Andrena cerasifolii TaxID=2819439 RepID=UPI004037D8DC